MPPQVLEPSAPPAPTPPARRAPRVERKRRPGASPLPVADPGRDVALDLVRGLAILILVVNHLRLESPLESATSALLSAAEVLVSVSGVVVGVVFGRRWRVVGARPTTAMLLRRARTLYLASVAVVAAVWVLRLVPGLATDALTVSPTMQPSRDLYAFDGLARTLLAIVTLEAGPWQISILGLFIAVLAAAPAVLWALERGWWPWLLVASWTLYAVGRRWPADVLPTQSERPFPVLVWQLLFVHGVVLGHYRQQITRAVRASGGVTGGAVVAVAAAATYVQLAQAGFAPIGLGRQLGVGPADWARWKAEHFDKSTLDIARVVTMVSITATIYLAFRRWERTTGALTGWLLLPFGRNSLYVFIMHVFVCLAVASIPAVTGNGFGGAGNTAVQIASVAVLWAMVRRQFLFRWMPR